ncbi:uncharacterized protein LOC113515805 [Galleria mellonella]|uniref:Uncharacterized protein LOC113515805 n=1 Tax=Galleria mellonella TaxID=7137 RepID=A0A6J1WLT4_GALME|nr:uncharacterized protein LOC113515805 [Galleria mellonella]
MCWRQVSKLQKTVFIVLFYVILYLLILYAMSPDTTLTFVNDEMQGDKYPLLFLVAPNMPVFSDPEGADVFRSRRCGNCFITNNKGFLPISGYDAVLVYGDRSVLSQTAAFMDPGKRYLIESSEDCLRNKLRRCSMEPKITSYSSKESYDLCGLCHLLEK